MLMPRIVPGYAAVLASIYILLSARVIRGRNRHAVALGTGGVADLERRVRVHANFAEYVPFALLLLSLAELRHVSALLLHGLCVALIVGRVLHAYGVSRSEATLTLRISGMVLTLTTLGVSALVVLWSEF